MIRIKDFFKIAFKDTGKITSLDSEQIQDSVPNQAMFEAASRGGRGSRYAKKRKREEKIYSINYLPIRHRDNVREIKSVTTPLPPSDQVITSLADELKHPSLPALSITQLETKQHYFQASSSTSLLQANLLSEAKHALPEADPNQYNILNPKNEVLKETKNDSLKIEQTDSVSPSVQEGGSVSDSQHVLVTPLASNSLFQAKTPSPEKDPVEQNTQGYYCALI